MTQKFLYRKQAWKVLKRMPWITLMGFLSVLVAAIVAGLFPFAFTKISHYAIKGNKELLNKWIILGAIISFLFFATMIIKYLAIKKFVYRSMTILRGDYCKNIYNQNLERFAKGGKGLHWDNLTNTLQEITEDYFGGMLRLIGAFMTIISAFISIALLNVYIAIILVVICIASRTILILFDKHLKKKTKQKANSRKEYGNELNDLAFGIETLFWNNNIESLGKRIDVANKNIQETNISFTKTDQWFKFINNLLSNIVNLAILVTLAIFVFKVENYSVVPLFLGIFLVLSVFQNALQEMMESIMVFRQTKKLRENPNYVWEKPKEKKIQNIEFLKSIEVKGLGFKYEDTKIIEDINFKINKGDKVAIVGKSGSGKSTLTQLLLKQLKPKSGKVLFDGVNIEEFDEQTYLRNIAYANNHNLVFNDSFKNNMLLFGGDEVNIAKLDKIFNLNFVESSQMILDNKKLSTGQQQRINLARLWVDKKPIIILDECFGNLDKKNANEILGNILKDKEVTIIVISHHLTATQTKLFDKIIKL